MLALLEGLQACHHLYDAGVSLKTRVSNHVLEVSLVGVIAAQQTSVNEGDFDSFK
jgi:hypothetical protein